MIWLYRLIFLPTLLLAIPYYGYRMYRRGGYSKSFSHRFGLFPKLPSKHLETSRIRVWIQAVSVGEVLALQPLIKLMSEAGNFEIVLTTTTSTGYAEARRRYQDFCLEVGIFPLDFWLFSRRSWNRIRPDAVVLTESELWPEHLHQASDRNIPAFLINARISDRSFDRFVKLRPLTNRLLSKFSAIMTGSVADLQKFSELVDDSSKLSSTGNLKFDIDVSNELHANQKRALRSELGFENQRGSSYILLGASTWPGEEDALLAAQQQLRADGIDCRLLLVPRHAERRDEIVRVLEQQTLSWHQRSRRKQAPSENCVYLADTTGELSMLTQVADLAFIGKSLPPHEGGQTPIEAAAFGIPVAFGPEMSNFKNVSKDLLTNGAARQVADYKDITSLVTDLVNDPSLKDKMGQAGRNWQKHHTGSAQKTFRNLMDKLYS